MNLEEFIIERIQQDHQIGQGAGGSGHLSDTSFENLKIESHKVPDGLKVKYSYTIVVETEFTYEPDNPPYQYFYEVNLLLDDQFNVLQKE